MTGELENKFLKTQQNMQHEILLFSHKMQYSWYVWKLTIQNLFRLKSYNLGLDILDLYFV